MAKGASEEGAGTRGNGFVAHSGLSVAGLGEAKGGRGGVGDEMTSRTVWVVVLVELGPGPSPMGMQTRWVTLPPSNSDFF